MNGGGIVATTTGIGTRDSGCCRPAANKARDFCWFPVGAAEEKTAAFLSW
jgi:hypothetical protein